MAYKLRPDEPVREAIARTGAEQLDNAVRVLREDLGDDPVTAVHTARKAVKKERALLRLVRGAVPAKRRRRENAALRMTAQGLSGARDADVMLQTVEALAERFPGQLPESTYEGIREPLFRERDEQRAQLLDSALGSQAVQELGAVRVRIGDWRIRRGGWRTLEPGLERTYRDGRRALRVARRSPSVESLHDWRKRVKDLWYAHRLLAPVGGPAVRGLAKDLDQLSDLLGDDHDLAVLRRRLIGGATSAGVDIDGLVGLIDHRRSELQEQAWHLGERVYAEKPAAFIRRMHRWWTAGRALATPGADDPAGLAQATRAESA